MKIKDLFPKFNLPVKFADLKGDSGQYWFKSDCIVLDRELRKPLPIVTGKQVFNFHISPQV